MLFRNVSTAKYNTRVWFAVAGHAAFVDSNGNRMEITFLQVLQLFIWYFTKISVMEFNDVQKSYSG